MAGQPGPAAQSPALLARHLSLERRRGRPALRLRHLGEAPDEALLLRFTPPECEHWNFQLCNLWQENLDCYEERQGYVTKFSARREPDGSVVLVIAERDPGVGGNWLDSYGHVRGIMGLRLIRTTQPPPVTLQRVSLEKLARAGLAGLAHEPVIESGEITA